MDAWLETGKVSEVARRGVVTEDVARKLVHHGQGEYPPIKTRAEKVRASQLKETDDQRLQETKAARAAVRKVIGDTIGGLKIMKFVPNGKRVQNADGTTYYECDEKTYSTIVNVFDKVMELRDGLDDVNTMQRRIGVGVQVNVGDRDDVSVASVDTPEGTRAMAEQIKKQFFPAIKKAYGKDEGDKRILRAIAEAARAQAGDA